MALPSLILITDWRLPDLLDRLRRALEAGPGIAVQHRQPDAPIREFLANAKALQAACGQAPLFINGRLDVAVALGAHLHLPSATVRATEARPHLPGRWISIAVHDAVDGQFAKDADLALLSPVHRPGSKPNDTRSPLGEPGFRALAGRLPCPAYALGGMDAERTRSLRPKGVAVMSAVWSAPDPRAAAEGLLRELSSAADGRP